MGTPDFAAPALARLHRAGYDIAMVWSQPDRPAGRGLKLSPPPLAQKALALGLPLRQPARLKDETAIIAAHAIDLIITAAYGRILPPVFLAEPPLGCLNLHASLLPLWRGADPIRQAILAGDSKTGVSLMVIEEGLDTGPVLAQSELPLDALSGGEASARLAQQGAALLLACLPDFLAGKLTAQKQDSARASYAGKLPPEARRLNWRESAEICARRVRAFAPAPGAWCLLPARQPLVHSQEQAGQRLRILQAEVLPASAKNDKTGRVEDCAIVCGKDRLRPLQVQKAGGRKMAWEEFLRGRKLAEVC